MPSQETNNRTLLNRHRYADLDVLLVSMPFGLVVTPSLALGLLHASIDHLPYRIRQWYPSLAFAERVGFQTYWTAGNRWEIGDWAFAAELFPDHDLDPQGFIDHVLQQPSKDQKIMLASVPGRESWVNDTVDAALQVRSAAHAFIEECLHEVQLMRPRVVAFSCLFQQIVPSLALARRIKEVSPDTVVVIGGNECYGVKAIEVARQFPFLDAVASGAGDIVFPQIVDRAMQGSSLDDLQGIYSHQRALLIDSDDVVNAASPKSMDDLPYPIFDGFFQDLEELKSQIPLPIYLSMETSRGCWWAQNPKRHCTFCSLNGAISTYSSKSSERMTQEIAYFAREYPGKALIMTDSIVEMDYFNDAFPRLASMKLDVTIQYEMRATMTKPQLRILRDAGVTLVQPGIESLSTTVLKMMRKFTTTLSNVQFLKWAQEFGMTTMWNMLGGFPEEPPEAYYEIERIIPLITHLPPPSRFRLVELNRWAPMFEEAEALGVTALNPLPYYKHVYPFDDNAIANIAAYFEYDYVVPQDVNEYSRGVQEAIRVWKAAYDSGSSALYSVDDGIELAIWDRRPIAKASGYKLQGLARFLYDACDQIRSVKQLKDLAEADGYHDVTLEEIEERLTALVDRLLMIQEGERYLSLAVQRTEQVRQAEQLAERGFTSVDMSLAPGGDSTHYTHGHDSFSASQGEYIPLTSSREG
jgi:ribosomal peptide maturation radical SAM protein 1